MGLWSEDLKNEIIAAGGSIQGVATIPDSLKELYKTVWEIKQRVGLSSDKICIFSFSTQLIRH